MLSATETDCSSDRLKVITIEKYCSHIETLLSSDLEVIYHSVLPEYLFDSLSPMPEKERKEESAGTARKGHEDPSELVTRSETSCLSEELCGSMS